MPLAAPTRAAASLVQHAVKVYLGVTDGAGVLTLQPLIQAWQVVVVAARGVHLGVLCSGGGPHQTRGVSTRTNTASAAATRVGVNARCEACPGLCATHAAITHAVTRIHGHSQTWRQSGAYAAGTRASIAVRWWLRPAHPRCMPPGMWGKSLSRPRPPGQSPPPASLHLLPARAGRDTALVMRGALT